MRWRNCMWCLSITCKLSRQKWLYRAFYLSHQENIRAGPNQCFQVNNFWWLLFVSSHEKILARPNHCFQVKNLSVVILEALFHIISLLPAYSQQCVKQDSFHKVLWGFRFFHLVLNIPSLSPPSGEKKRGCFQERCFMFYRFAPWMLEILHVG